MRVFVGSEALASGAVSRYRLTADYRRVLPDIYAPRHLDLTLDDRIAAAWLWSRRQAVIAGVAASALHGALWVGDDAPIELNHVHNRMPAGIHAADHLHFSCVMLHSAGKNYRRRTVRCTPRIFA